MKKHLAAGYVQSGSLAEHGAWRRKRVAGWRESFFLSFSPPLNLFEPEVGRRGQKGGEGEKTRKNGEINPLPRRRSAWSRKHLCATPTPDASTFTPSLKIKKGGRLILLRLLLRGGERSKENLHGCMSSGRSIKLQNRSRKAPPWPARSLLHRRRHVRGAACRRAGSPSAGSPENRVWSRTEVWIAARLSVCAQATTKMRCGSVCLPKTSQHTA